MGLRQKTLERRTHRYWHVVFFAAVLIILFVAIRGLGRVLTPVVAALVLTYLLDPLVTAMNTKLRMPRWLGTLVLVLAGLAVITVLFVVLVPVVIHEVEVFGAKLESLPKTLVPWLESTFNVEMPRSFNELWTRFGGEVKSASGSIFGSIGGVAGRVAKGTAGFFSALGDVASSVGTVLLVPVFTFYFLPQFPKMVAGTRELIPFRYRVWVDETTGEINTALASWMRGQITVMATLATLYAVGLKFVAQLDMAVLIGLLTGMMAFIPYVGFALGLTAAVLVCLLRSGGLDVTQLLATLGVFGVVQLLDGLILTPRIVGQKAGIGPVGVLVALLVGGKVFGFVGVLLAVPVAAALVILLKRTVSAYQGSLFFTRGRDDLLGRSDSPSGES